MIPRHLHPSVPHPSRGFFAQWVGNRMTLHSRNCLYVLFPFPRRGYGTARAQPGRLNAQKIADGVWFLPGDAAKGYCNNIVIEMRDYLIVVDANYPGRARELVAEIHQLSPKPVRFVFDTHAHRDHAYGNIVWTDAGATTFAYQGVADEMDRYEPRRWRSTAAERDDVRSLNLTDAPRPQLLFRQSPFILKDATREVRFYFLGWAHTRGDGFVWLPKERILCTGDAAVNGPRNKLWDANIENWPRVLARPSPSSLSMFCPATGTQAVRRSSWASRHFFRTSSPQ